MEQQIYTIDAFKKREKKLKRKEWFRSKLDNTKNWICNNKEMILLLGPAAIGAVTTGVTVVSRQAKLRKEKDLKELYCYDRSLGHYWRLRRELSNSEWVEIDKRKNNGERLADILSELKVLK